MSVVMAMFSCLIVFWSIRFASAVFTASSIKKLGHPGHQVFW